jgi:translation initiation factor RLI1
MPNTMVSLNYEKCKPDNCTGGICIAASACPLKLINQEEPFEPPMANSTLCKGCAKCISACPQQAISLV